MSKVVHYITMIRHPSSVMLSFCLLPGPCGRGKMAWYPPACACESVSVHFSPPIQLGNEVNNLYTNCRARYKVCILFPPSTFSSRS